ncbi:MAG: hypothetical protein ACI92S_004617 [Planctomycetaceae bacterium]|jgi:hypothetical protein
MLTFVHTLAMPCGKSRLVFRALARKGFASGCAVKIGAREEFTPRGCGMTRGVIGPILLTRPGFGARAELANSTGSISEVIGTACVEEWAGEVEVIQRFVIAAAAVLGLTASGCMLPEHYTPGGYSSTCEQRLQESAIDWSQMPEGTMRQSISSGVH